MKKKYKPINFNSKSIFTALFTTIILYILRIFMLGLFEEKIKNEVICELIVYTIFIVVIFIIERKYLMSKLKSLKKDLNNKILNVSLVFAGLILLEYIINFILIKVLNTNPTGQGIVSEFLTKQPVLFILFIVIFTPILETLLYYYPYKNINNKKLALVFSSIVFALFHMFTINSLLEILFLIPYICMALAFGYGMYKTNNVYVSMILHTINNALAIVLLLI